MNQLGLNKEACLFFSKVELRKFFLTGWFKVTGITDSLSFKEDNY